MHLQIICFWNLSRIKINRFNIFSPKVSRTFYTTNTAVSACLSSIFKKEYLKLRGVLYRNRHTGYCQSSSRRYCSNTIFLALRGRNVHRSLILPLFVTSQQFHSPWNITVNIAILLNFNRRSQKGSFIWGCTCQHSWQDARVIN